ncbi:MAG: hypothetical protein HYU46_09185 [Deltaproteobacteria bacterium]|nr:hypothetical protein [Deltaproteobacteria bacterium]MBI2366570.1 hypothetical protein [Deltaproteobacteria bacterium]MBI3065863.1 hypothetical protein [Deltaproteobacteria bacterium]
MQDGFIETGGGGGYGPPSKPSRELIERDLRRGYVTPQAAVRDYRVTMDSAIER